MHNSHLGHVNEIIEGQSAQPGTSEIGDRRVMRNHRATGGAIPEIDIAITILTTGTDPGH